MLTSCSLFFHNEQLPPPAATEEEGGAKNAGYCIVEYDNHPAAQRAHRIG